MDGKIKLINLSNTTGGGKQRKPLEQIMFTQLDGHTGFLIEEFFHESS